MVRSHPSPLASKYDVPNPQTPHCATKLVIPGLYLVSTFESIVKGIYLEARRCLVKYEVNGWEVEVLALRFEIIVLVYVGWILVDSWEIHRVANRLKVCNRTFAGSIGAVSTGCDAG